MHVSGEATCKLRADCSIITLVQPGEAFSHAMRNELPNLKRAEKTCAFLRKKTQTLSFKEAHLSSRCGIECICFSSTILIGLLKMIDLCLSYGDKPQRAHFFGRRGPKIPRLHCWLLSSSLPGASQMSSTFLRRIYPGPISSSMAEKLNAAAYGCTQR
jgi:hypothetical protein